MIARTAVMVILASPPPTGKKHRSAVLPTTYAAPSNLRERWSKSCCWERETDSSRHSKSRRFRSSTQPDWKNRRRLLDFPVDASCSRTLPRQYPER